MNLSVLVLTFMLFLASPSLTSAFFRRALFKHVMNGQPTDQIVGIIVHPSYLLSLMEGDQIGYLLPENRAKAQRGSRPGGFVKQPASVIVSISMVAASASLFHRAPSCFLMPLHLFSSHCFHHCTRFFPPLFFPASPNTSLTYYLCIIINIIYYLLLFILRPGIRQAGKFVFSPLHHTFMLLCLSPYWSGNLLKHVTSQGTCSCPNKHEYVYVRAVGAFLCWSQAFCCEHGPRTPTLLLSVCMHY